MSTEEVTQNDAWKSHKIVSRVIKEEIGKENVI